jgi:hypothetical protein
MKQKGRTPPPPTPPFDPSKFLADREAALLSMDEQQIRAYFRQYNGDAGPSDPEVFWRGIHKARTALQSLPMEARQESKRWLLAHGSEPMDDGEVPL